jgi:DNA-binding transcriptional MerR regulator
MKSPGYFRGQIAKNAKINIETLRYYEKINLISKPQRTDKGYRLYPEKVIDQLEFIKQVKSLGFTLEEIMHMFSITNKKENSAKLSNLVQSKINEIEFEILELEKRKASLQEVMGNLNETNTCPMIQYYFNS